MAGVAEPELDSWPPGITVSGRVLNHRGEAVAGADVLLLGSEQLTVWADPGQEEGQVRYNLSTRPTDATAAVKTDGQGRFSLRRPGSSADRIVVVCQQMLLWKVTRKNVIDNKNVEITLPEPITLDHSLRHPREVREARILDRGPDVRPGRLEVGFHPVPTDQGSEPRRENPPALAARSVRRRTDQLHAPGKQEQ